MQRLKYIVFPLLLIFVASASAAGHYRVDYKLPNPSQWKLANSKNDPRGYIKFYKRRGADPLKQVFMVDYEKDVNTSAETSMKEVSAVFTRLPCKVKRVSPIKKTGSTLVFTSELNQCQGGRSMWQVQKVFNAKDGQYSVSYASGNAKLPNELKRKMTRVVSNSRLLPAA